MVKETGYNGSYNWATGVIDINDKRMSAYEPFCTNHVQKNLP